MFGKFIEASKAKRAVKEIEKHPIYGLVLAYLRGVLNDESQGLGKYWSEQGKRDLLAKTLAIIQQDLSQPNPVQAVRMRILSLMLDAAKFQVLVVPPAPEPDATGVRSYEGVTGELKARIPELAKVDEELEAFFYGLDHTPQTSNDMWDAVLMRYWALILYMNAYNQVRCALDDWHKDPQKDWFHPCYASLCIWQENHYRQELGMPAAISGGNADLKALAHSTWMNRIEEGHKELRLAWERSWTEAFNEPSPYATLAT